MSKTIAELLITDIAYLDCDDTVEDAQHVLDETELSGMPVLNPDKSLFGILTQHDILNFYRRPLNNGKAVRVWEVCTTRPVVATLATPVEAVASLMVQERINHVMIVDDNEQLLGVVTSEDLLSQVIVTSSDAAHEFSKDAFARPHLARHFDK